MREHIEGITPEEELIRMFVKHAGFAHRAGKLSKEKLFSFCRHPFFSRLDIAPAYIYLHIKKYYAVKNKNRSNLN